MTRNCSNIAVAVIATNQGTFDTHEYMDRVRNQDSGAFMEAYHFYRDRFSLPTPSPVPADTKTSG